MSEPQGVPIEEATAKDFMMVRAALVRRLGGADQALVWARIFYRCDEDSKHAEERDGVHWWRASHGLLAKETGLSEKQARTAVESLYAGGFVDRKSFVGPAYSYRPITYLPIWADTVSARSGTSIRPGGQINLPDWADAPLVETYETEDTPIVPTPDPVEEAFTVVWNLWPTPRRGTTKKSGASFRTAVAEVGGIRKVDVIVAAVRRDVDVWRTWPRSDVQFVPLLSTWLNQERWTAAPPLPKSGSTAQRKQDANLALAARYREEENREEVGAGQAAGLLSLDRGA